MFDLARYATSSLIFGSRNTGKSVFNIGTEIDDKGRAPAAIIQLRNAAASASKLDNALGKGTKAAMDAVCKASEHSKVLDCAVKGVNSAQKLVNPLLCGAAAYRVITSDNKEETLKKEVCAMSGMFGLEYLYKKGVKGKYMTGIHNGMNNKYAKSALAIIEGIGLVGVSILGYAGGQKAAKRIFDPKVTKDNVNQIKEEIARLESKIDPEKSAAKKENPDSAPALSALAQKNVMA